MQRTIEKLVGESSPALVEAKGRQQIAEAWPNAVIKSIHHARPSGRGGGRTIQFIVEVP